MRTRVARMLATFALMALFFAPRSAGAKDAEKVHVGVYVNQIHELSLKENFFVIDFYVWFRWRNEALKPIETYSVAGGRVESKGEVMKKKLEDGTLYAHQRIVAKITKFWDVTNYPFDHHSIAIHIEEEELESEGVEYLADVENSGASPHIKLTGWRLTKMEAKASVADYTSNFGDISLPSGKESHYARLTVSMSLERPGKTYLFKLFFGLWIASGIAFLSFFIKPTNLDPRFGLGVGAIFAAIASEYVVTGSLPEVNLVTLADKLHLVAFAFIFLVLAQSTFSLWCVETGREPLARRLDKLCGVLVPVLYAAVNVFYIGKL